MAIKALSRAQKQRLERAFSRIAAKWQKRLFRAAGRQFARDKERLLAALREIVGQKQAVNWDDVLMHWAEIYALIGDDWRETFVPLLQGAIEDQAGAQALALGMEWDVRNLLAEEWFDTYTLQFAEEVQQTTGDTLNALLKDAQTYGWTIPEMEDHLGLVFAQWIHGNKFPEHFEWFSERMPLWRREMIARTETIRSSNAGINALYKQWGVAYKEWLTAMDDRTCDWCAEMNGKVIPVGLNFWEHNQTMTVDVGGKPQSMTFKYEAVTHPPLHPNCRCTLVPVVEV